MRKLVLVSGGSLALVAALRGARRRLRERAGPIADSTRVGRAANVGGLAARRAARRGALRVRTIGADEERKTELEEAYAFQTAAEVAERLGQMRGVLMKVGQMVSFIFESLPESTQVALSSLQEDAPPMAPSLAAAVVDAELGSPPDQLFSTWHPEPAAAASVGQVHRAVTRTGDEVAVKVQYPGLDVAIEADLANTGMLYALLGRYFSGLDTKALIDEFSQRIIEELDYENELANQTEFREMFANHPWVRIPRPLAEFSAHRVLTSEWIDGDRFAEFAATASADNQRHSAEVIWRFSQHSIHRHLVFNGDPHPGNYRFHQDGTVSFLDFGMVKRWAQSEWTNLKRTLTAVILERDPDAICEAMRATGFLPSGLSVDPRRVANYVSAAYEPYLTNHFEFTPEWMRSALNRAANVGAENADVTKALNIPPSFLLLNRVVWGVNALMSKLHAAGPYRAMLLEYLIDAEPATEIGRAEKEWREQLAAGPTGDGR